MKKVLVAIFLLLFTAYSQAEIVVIGNKNNISAFNSNLIADIFMGRTRTLSSGRTVLPLDQPALRTEFYQKITLKPIEQINAYWARMTFTGQTSPPIALPNDKAVLKAIHENKDAIGYIDAKYADNSVRILFILIHESI